MLVAPSLERLLQPEAAPQRRILQVATAASYPAGLERLRRQLPTLKLAAGGFVIALEDHTPEEVLARCVAEGVPVAGSVIRYWG